MYLGNQKRRSTLGRRFRNGDRPADKVPVCPPSFPTITPRSGLGRSRAGTLKASPDYKAKKQLFLKSPRFTLLSSEKKKNKDGRSSKVPCNSPNESQSSYHSDSSLNLTGVQSMKDPSPDHRNITASWINTTKSYQEYRHPKSPVEKYNPMEQPKSPGFSHYERLLRLERSMIKQPVDPDDLELIKFLKIDESSNSNPKGDIKSLNGREEKKVLNEFSTFVPSKYNDKELKFISSCEAKASENLEGTFRLQDEATKFIANRIKQTPDLECRLKLCKDKDDSLFRGSSEFVSNVCTKSNHIFGNTLKSQLPNEGGNQEEIQSLNFAFGSDKFTHTIQEQSMSCENVNLTFNCKPNTFSVTNFSQTVTPNVQEVVGKLNNTNIDLDTTITNQDFKVPLTSAKKLSIINEKDEKESHDITFDLNSTDSFILAENTLIEHEETIIESQHKVKDFKLTTNGVKNILEVDNSSDNDEELYQALEKFENMRKGMNVLKLNSARLLKDMEKLDQEMNSFKPILKKIIAKRQKLIREENKENNVPVTASKQQFKPNKWFNELKSNNPDLLKTPNPDRRNVSRRSIANQSVMTPHSLSIVLYDQLEELDN